MTGLLLASFPSIIVIPPVTPVPETLSALVVGRVLQGLLQYLEIVVSPTFALNLLSTFICPRTVKFIVHWGVLMHVILVVR